MHPPFCCVAAGPCLFDSEVAGPVVVGMGAPADTALAPVDGLKDALRSGHALV